MKRAEVYKLGPTWLIAQEDGKFWCADIADGWQAHYRRFHTHGAALAHALAEVGHTEKNSAARRDEEKRDG